jgi:hypothetical protein
MELKREAKRPPLLFKVCVLVRSCLVVGDLEGYAGGVKQLDSLVDGKDMVDVVIKGRREPRRTIPGH